MQPAGHLDTVLSLLPPDVDAAVVRDGPRTIVAVAPEEVIHDRGAHALERLNALRTGWWAGMLSYDLGRAIERLPSTAAEDPPLPDLVVARFGARLTFDPDRPTPVLEGAGPGRELLEDALRRTPHTTPELPHPVLGSWRSSFGREGYETAVRAILDHLRAGDCYQVNLTRRLETEATTDSMTLFRALLRANPAPHAAFFRAGDLAIVSASPERFLRRDASRIETRPIKGTGKDPAALTVSEKDRAENVMIVDLARHDLGRVCAYGSVTVPALCAVEPHPGLYHLVSTVTGTLCPGVATGDLIRATFPPASVTGAPKPRVLEIIESLEPVRRGPYCGAVGWLDADREILDLNVAIRTFTFADGRVLFGVGGGVVVDSDPRAEWEETELKAAKLLAAAGAAEAADRLSAGS